MTNLDDLCGSWETYPQKALSNDAPLPAQNSDFYNARFAEDASRLFSSQSDAVLSFRISTGIQGG
jgi:hypothetical protein